MILLGIDTSGKTASVAVCTETSVLAQTTVYTKLTHSQVILPICNDVLKSAGTELSDVDVIAAAAGPGSYTGLRIGIAAVQAMCFALDKHCIGISTLEALAHYVSL
ncbi:MAG: tRNA (adenosine(37)-N6)-threonylcarbamoyltransferase complex dimerization subunit type 1 TsaB, partial [Oscillospiraceae bacterium]|nr:tRNA (adenosine(37)-N6)-threonylcarbamoyltransferase complex dimerization subunit type 1 TsaB [Oscillospiraceae bacterium]